MRKQLFMATAAATALFLTGIGTSTAAEGPIVVGSVNTMTGPATFPEASQAARAVFEKFNANGGLDGRKIKYVTKDDQGNLSKARGLAKTIVEDDHAVAMVGGASLIQCQANARYYKYKNILSIPGVGVDRGCFESPNIAPANVGPFNDTTLTLIYGSEVLGLDKMCALLEIAGNTLPAYKAAIKKWSDLTGEKLLYIDASVPYGAANYTSYLVKAKNAGCQTIVNNPVEPDSIAMLKNAHAMGWDNVTWMLLTSVYSANYANSISDAGKGIYVPAEFYPFTKKNKITNGWRDLMTENNIPLTAFSQGGYLAAHHFLTVIKDMHANGIAITRENVTKALHNMEPIHNPMIGTPYVFGTAKRHANNTCGWPIQLMSGTHEWQFADQHGDDWLCIGEFSKG